MHQILVLGAGKIGALISGLLAESGDYHVQLADKVERAAGEVAAAHGFADQSHMGRWLMRYTGQTPGEIRRRGSGR